MSDPYLIEKMNWQWVNDPMTCFEQQVWDHKENDEQQDCMCFKEFVDVVNARFRDNMAASRE